MSRGMLRYFGAAGPPGSVAELTVIAALPEAAA
jgi:hypothetical protein